MRSYYSLSMRPKEKTQKEYAEYLGVNIRTVQNWEQRGSGDTTSVLLEKIAELQRQIDKLTERQQG